MKKRRARPTSAAGFTLVEALVALALALVIFMVASTEFIDAARHHHAQSQIAGMHQNARNLVEFMSRELIQAGYGMGSAPDAACVIIANEPTVLTMFSPTAITFRWNASDITSSLTKDMAAVSSDLVVANTTGFAAGQRVMIWDDTGAWDWTVVSLVSSSTVLKHGGVSKPYLVFDNPRVSVIHEVSFRYNAATREVERMADGGPWSTVARNVVAFELHYRDENANEIFPADDGTRANVQSIEIHVTVRTEEQDLIVREFRTYEVVTTVAPRNLRSLG